jgi:hypothetical protein
MLKRLWRVGGASEAAVVDRLRQFVTWNLGGGKSQSRSGPFLPFGTGGKAVVSRVERRSPLSARSSDLGGGVDCFTSFGCGSGSYENANRFVLAHLKQ